MDPNSTWDLIMTDTRTALAPIEKTKIDILISFFLMEGHVHCLVHANHRHDFVGIDLVCHQKIREPV